MSDLLNDPPADFPHNSFELQGKEPTGLVLDGFLRREQLAEQLEKSERTLDRWHALRIGPPRICIGRTIFYDIRSVRAWLSSREQRTFRVGQPRRFHEKLKQADRGS